MATTKDLANQNEQFVLRVKRNSEVDKVMRAMLGSDTAMSNDEMVEVGGYKRSGWLMRFFDGLFDNIRVSYNRGDDEKKAKLHYVDIFPGAPESVGDDVVSYDDSDVGDLSLRLRWSQAPPLVEGIGDKFREPSWFKTMKTMVDEGRHIALSGPASVGKDTAVEELAAKEGRILVTIGGDAGFRRRDLVGSLQISKGHSYFDVAEYAAAVVNGWWVLITEVNAADADALMYINAQMAAPYIVTIAGKAYPVHPDFRLFVSYNPGYVGTKPLPQSFKDRFFSIKVPFFSETLMRKVLQAHGMPGEYSSDLYDSDLMWTEKIVKYGMNMWNANERGQMRYQISIRRLMDAVVLMKNGGCDGDVKKALQMAVIGAIDSQIESKTAEQILDDVMRGF